MEKTVSPYTTKNGLPVSKFLTFSILAIAKMYAEFGSNQMPDMKVCLDFLSTTFRAIAKGTLPLLMATTLSIVELLR